MLNLGYKYIIEVTQYNFEEPFVTYKFEFSEYPTVGEIADTLEYVKNKYGNYKTIAEVKELFELIK